MAKIQLFTKLLPANQKKSWKTEIEDFQVQSSSFKLIYPGVSIFALMLQIRDLWSIGGTREIWAPPSKFSEPLAEMISRNGENKKKFKKMQVNG